MFKEIILQLHGKRGSSTTVQSYKPTAEELRLQKQAADYGDAVAPNALWLNTVAKNLLQDSLGTIQVDYDGMNRAAQAQLAQAQSGIAGLTRGEMPAAYQANMENSIRAGVQNTMGKSLNLLGNRGVLNSSVTGSAMDDISKNAATTMAEQYSNNIASLNGLFGQQAALSGQGITTAAAAQEAAQQPALNAWNASLGLNQGGTGMALSAVSGQGTTTTTQRQPSSGGLFGGILTSMAGGWANAGFPMCLDGDTLIDLVGKKGRKKIKDVVVGDKVWCSDGKIDGVETVEFIAPSHEVECFKVSCRDRNGVIHEIIASATQPFREVSGGFVEVGVMKIKTLLAGVGEVFSITSVGKRKVYDFRTDGSNCYYANGFLAHGAYKEEVLKVG